MTSPRQRLAARGAGMVAWMTNLDLTEILAELNAKEADLRRSIERLTAPAVDGASIGFGKRIG